MKKINFTTDNPELDFKQNHLLSENNPINKKIVETENPPLLFSKQNNSNRKFLSIQKNSENTLSSTKITSYKGSYINNLKNGKGKLVTEQNLHMKVISKMIYSMVMVNILAKHIIIKVHFRKGKKVEKALR